MEIDCQDRHFVGPTSMRDRNRGPVRDNSGEPGRISISEHELKQIVDDNIEILTDIIHQRTHGQRDVGSDRHSYRTYLRFSFGICRSGTT